MIAIVRRALMATLVLSLLTGVLYPLLVTVAGQLLFEEQADGSLVRDADGTVLGSSLVGQSWEGEQWMYGRPSAVDYDARLSGGSHLGPASPELTDTIRRRAQAVLAIESPYRPGLAVEQIPVDLLLASGSGLDPDISVEAAKFQAPRLAAVRGLSLDAVMELIDALVKAPPMELFGAPRVNVMELNRALQEMSSPTS